MHCLESATLSLVKYKPWSTKPSTTTHRQLSPSLLFSTQ